MVDFRMAFDLTWGVTMAFSDFRGPAKIARTCLLVPKVVTAVGKPVGKEEPVDSAARLHISCMVCCSRLSLRHPKKEGAVRELVSGLIRAQAVKMVLFIYSCVCFAAGVHYLFRRCLQGLHVDSVCSSSSFSYVFPKGSYVGVIAIHYWWNSTYEARNIKLIKSRIKEE